MARMASNEMHDTEGKVSIISTINYESSNNFFCFALVRWLSAGVFLDVSYNNSQIERGLIQ